MVHNPLLSSVDKIKNYFYKYKILIKIFSSFSNSFFVVWGMKISYELKLFFGGILWFCFYLLITEKMKSRLMESTKKLGISSDTVILDTVYNHLRSRLM